MKNVLFISAKTQLKSAFPYCIYVVDPMRPNSQHKVAYIPN